MTDYQRAFWNAFVLRTGSVHAVGLSLQRNLPGPSIYRRAVFARRYDALAKIFPRICSLLPNKLEHKNTHKQSISFDSLTYSFISQTPIYDPDLANIGVSFASFCAQWGAQNAFPDWLAPMARFEWAAHLLSISQPADFALQNQPLTPEDALVQRVELSPNARWVVSEYALAEAWLNSSTDCPQKRRCASIAFRVKQTLLAIDLEGEDIDLFMQLISTATLGNVFEKWAGRRAPEDLAKQIATWMEMGLLYFSPSFAH